MKKIKFIKENDLYMWEVGQIQYVDFSDNGRGVVVVELHPGSSPPEDYPKLNTVKLFVDFLKAKDYVEDVKEEPTLVERVGELIAKWEKECGSGPNTLTIISKYGAIELYDYIVEELPKVKGSDSIFVVTFNPKKGIYFIENTFGEGSALKETSEEICKAMIDSEVFKPYLLKIFPHAND